MTPSCELLTKIADEARAKLMASNIYNAETDKQYSATHPNATQALGGSDDPANTKGRGTGIYLDSTGGGTNVDINGRPDVLNSGRKAIYSNLYNPDKPYDCFI